MEAGHVPTIYDFLAASVPVTLQTLAAATLVVLVLGLWVRRDLAKGDPVFPDGKLSLRGFVEVMLEGIVNLARDTMGEKWAKFMPLVGTLGVFILVSNLMGLIPGVGGPTSYVETNVAWAIIAVLVSEAVAIYERGFGGWLAHFAQGPLWIAPLTLPIEMLSHLIRLGSLTVRLTANMFADHTLLGLFLSFPLAVSLVFPWAVLGLGVFVAFVQAFIFTFLTMIYIGEGLEEHAH